jgi:hypothetical protein
MVIAYSYSNMASMALEIVWMAIALFGLAQLLRRKAR